MAIRSTIISMAAAVILLTACDVKDPIYETAHPNHGKITLTIDWSARGTGIGIPDSYIVKVGEYSASLTGTTNTIDNLFEPGDYTAYVHNTANNLVVSGTTVTTNYTAGIPGWFFTGKQNIAVEKNTDKPLTIPMAQQVRQLTLVVEPAGGSVNQIAGITGTLSGAAGSYNMASGAHGAPSSVALTFTKGTDGKWSAIVRLLGVTGSEQTLTGTITFTGGTPASIPFDSDLTTALAGFNADKKTPLTLGGTVVETPTGAGFTASINGWDVIQQGGIIAD